MGLKKSNFESQLGGRGGGPAKLVKSQLFFSFLLNPSLKEITQTFIGPAFFVDHTWTDRSGLMGAAGWQCWHPNGLLCPMGVWKGTTWIVGRQESKLFTESETIMLALRIFQHWLISKLWTLTNLACLFHPNTLVFFSNFIAPL